MEEGLGQTSQLGLLHQPGRGRAEIRGMVRLCEANWSLPFSTWSVDVSGYISLICFDLQVCTKEQKAA